jgi:hypothetical protein
MIHRREEHAGERDERYAAEQCIKGGKQLPCIRIQVVHRTHTGQDHARIQECIKPQKPAEVMIAPGSDPDGEQENKQGEPGIADLPPDKCFAGQKRLLMMFERHLLYLKKVERFGSVYARRGEHGAWRIYLGQGSLTSG